MRKIKFRGKRLKDEEWITGDLITETDSDMKVERSFIHLRLSPISFTDDALSSTICLYEVDPETVVEYTGLKDSNGNEIWEGDLISAQAGEEYQGFREFSETCVVKCGDGGFNFVYRSEQGYEVYSDIGHFNPKDVEVIGNVWENPDLLEKEV